MTDVPKPATEIAREWIFHSSRFGITAEILNGVYSNEDCARLAHAVVDMEREIASLRGKREKILREDRT